MKIFILTEYENNTYSDSGISENQQYFFLSEESARLKAKELGLEIVEYCKDPGRHATLSEEEVLP